MIPDACAKVRAGGRYGPCSRPDSLATRYQIQAIILGIAVTVVVLAEVLNTGLVARGNLLRELVGQSAPATLDFLIMTLGSFVINYLVSDFGRNPIAAYGASLRIEQIALLPLFGIATALARLTGQNNGAERLDRAKEPFRISVRISIVAAVAILAPVLRGLKRPVMIMWIGLYGRLLRPLRCFHCWPTPWVWK